MCGDDGVVLVMVMVMMVVRQQCGGRDGVSECRLGSSGNCASTPQTLNYYYTAPGFVYPREDGGGGGASGGVGVGTGGAGGGDDGEERRVVMVVVVVVVRNDG